MTDEGLFELDGKGLYYGFLAGAFKVIQEQHYINKINVFPVPDGDTGSNMAATVRYIIDKVRPDISFKKTADSIASAALDGARGNSGIIFAQFLHGFNEKAQAEKEFAVDVKTFARLIRNAFSHAYRAIESPVEGTIITVIREWVDYVDSIKEKIDDFFKLLPASLKIAQVSLKETPQKLNVLKKYRVVDAGAQGFVFFLEGIMDYFRERNVRKILRLKSKEVEAGNGNEVITPGDLTFRYCTETVLESAAGISLDKDALRGKVKDLGDSLVIAGSEKKWRIHIHTDTPADFFYSLKDFGTLSFQKSDDMLKQYEIAHRRKWKIALVTDSSCDLPQEILDQYQVQVVPINLHFGLNNYLDKVTITPDQFYRMLDQSPQFPTTSQPHSTAFRNLYGFLAGYYESIIAVHLSRNLSGTWQNSKKAAEQVSKETGKKISVIDSRHLSGSLGLIVYRAARSIEAGLNHEEIMNCMEDWISRAAIMVSVKTLKSMVRGGRVSPMKGLLAKALNLKPVVSMDSEGKSCLYKKAFSQKGNIRKVLKVIAGKIKTQAVWKYSILHAHDESGARAYADKMTALLGKAPDFIIDISPVVGLNAGCGALAVAIMFE
ncbi:MAG: fatty acid kinase [Acidobacteriota bacterium]|nr:fatty acid kinase [Acidobacteriota bacterium]